MISEISHKFQYKLKYLSLTSSEIFVSYYYVFYYIKYNYEILYNCFYSLFMLYHICVISISRNFRRNVLYKIWYLEINIAEIFFFNNIYIYILIMLKKHFTKILPTCPLSLLNPYLTLLMGTGSILPFIYSTF